MLSRSFVARVLCLSVVRRAFVARWRRAERARGVGGLDACVELSRCAIAAERLAEAQTPHSNYVVLVYST